MLHWRTKLGALVVVAGGLWAAAAQAADPVVLKMTSFVPKNDVNMTAWRAFVDDVNARAKGRLEIRWIGGPEAIPGFKQFEAVRNGVVDVMFGAESYYGQQVTSAPYTHLSRLTPWEERANGYYEFRRDLLRKHNIHYLGRAENGVWFHLFATKPYKSMADFKGQKIRVSGTYEAFVKALGAAPITLPGNEIYTALDRKTIDGYGWAVLGNISMSWHEVAKYIIEPRIFQMNIEALANLNSWNKLPADLQRLLTDAMIENEKKYTAVMAEIAEKEYAEMQAKGMQVVKFDPAEAKKYVDLAYESQWAAVIQASPEIGPKLKALLSK